MFSIIIPTYNRANFIIETLTSVKAQTYRSIEIILVDDGSTDNTKQVVEKWQKENDEGKNLVLRYFYQENAGVSAARNKGIEEIRGEYVQFLDSDDRLYPERLQRLAETFEKEKCDFIQTGFEGFDAQTGEIIQTLYGRHNQDQLELAIRGLLWANTLRSAFRTELVKRIEPWKTEMTCFEDREYVERAVVNAQKTVAIRDILASARRGGSTRISDKLRSYEGRTWRIYCEQRLANAIRDRDDISYELKQEFASRMYALGFRCNATGWKDLGKRCGEIASSFDVKLNNLGKRRYLAFKLGRLGGIMYQLLAGVEFNNIFPK